MKGSGKPANAAPWSADPNAQVIDRLEERLLGRLLSTLAVASEPPRGDVPGSPTDQPINRMQQNSTAEPLRCRPSPTEFDMARPLSKYPRIGTNEGKGPYAQTNMVERDGGT